MQRCKLNKAHTQKDLRVKSTDLQETASDDRRVSHQSLLLRRALATLLATQLVATVGCGTLGGLPTAPFTGQSLRPASSEQIEAPKPINSALSTQGSNAADASSARAPVVAAAYSAAIDESVACPEMNYYSQNCANDVTQSCRSGSCESGACGCVVPPDSQPYSNAQEYIFDGGDQQPAVVIKQDWSAAGVDPTDTVVYYETLAGSVCVRPTNRVPIYAPRFGAVRQVAGLTLATHAAGTERILAPVRVGRFDETDPTGTMVLPVAPHGEQQVGLIDAFQENYVGTPLDQVQPLVRMSSARVPFELVDPFRTGMITRQELIDVQELIQNARTWVNPESLSVEILNQPALQLKDTMASQDVFVYELPDKCAMRICKTASHTIANSGDIVSFTIRFDNAGVKPLGNAVIIDSLSPRLSYIEGSQQSSVGVRFSAEPNDVGSMILRWEIEEPVDPHDGGAISFDCRVR